MIKIIFNRKNFTMHTTENDELEILLNREIDAPAVMTHQEAVSRIKNKWYADEVKRY
jgi:hypothetical protein